MVRIGMSCSVEIDMRNRDEMSRGMIKKTWQEAEKEKNDDDSRAENVRDKGGCEGVKGIEVKENLNEKSAFI